jgi:GntR family transcriptional regulator
VPAIDRNSDLPVYRQIADQLRASIRAGDYAPGAKLRSERELSEEFQTSRVTIRQAIAELRAEGLIIAAHGRGLFVRERPAVRRLARNRLSATERAAGRGTFTTDANAQNFTPRVDVEIRTEVADATTAELLALPSGTEVLVRDRLMFADDQPVQIARSRLPLALVAGTPIAEPDPGPGGVYGRLADLGRAPAHFTELVTARMPKPEEASALHLPDGTPVLLVTRVAFDRDSVPVEANDMILAADRYELLYEIPADQQ